MPPNVLDTLLNSYLFTSFISNFFHFFHIRKNYKNIKSGKNNFSYYTWEDQPYRDFMFDLLICLEPFYERKNKILVNELDEFNVIQFVIKGKVALGYEIQKQKRYCVKYTNNIVIGAFGITFNMRAAFVYTCISQIEGFFIRKLNWLTMISRHSSIAKILKKNVLINYLTKIRGKVMISKRKAMLKVQ